MKCCFPSSSENRTKTLHCSSSVLPEQPSPPSSSPSPPPPQTHPHARHHRAEHHQTTLFLHEVLAASCIPPPSPPLPFLPPTDTTAETRTSAPRASSPPSPTLTPTAWPIATLIDRNGFHHYHNSSARRAPFTLLFGLDVIGEGKKFLSPSCF